MIDVIGGVLPNTKVPKHQGHCSTWNVWGKASTTLIMRGELEDFLYALSQTILQVTLLGNMCHKMGSLHGKSE